MKDEVQARFAERQSKRQGSLVKDKLIAPADFDTAESAAGTSLAQVEADKANVQQARAILHQAEVNLELTNIVSPTDGVVISRNVDVGQTVAASLSAPIIFVIAEDLRKMQVDTSVAEADVGKLTAGMDATFVPWTPFRANASRARCARSATRPRLQNVVTYDAVIDVNNSDLKLRPGMTANVNFVFANREASCACPMRPCAFAPVPRCSPRSSWIPSARARRRIGGGKLRTRELPPKARGDDRGSCAPRCYAMGGFHGRRRRPRSQSSVWVLRRRASLDAIKIGTTRRQQDRGGRGAAGRRRSGDQRCHAHRPPRIQPGIPCPVLRRGGGRRPSRNCHGQAHRGRAHPRCTDG
jgi:HlyD family secretion protein